MDALVLFEACLMGKMNHLPRRPYGQEHDDLIRSGNILIFEEHSSGIKRWTDGYNWSPSRVLNNFLIYRELEKGVTPEQKKKARKRRKNRGKNGIAKPESTRSNSSISTMVAPSVVPSCNGNGRNNSDQTLIGSLVNSYPFKGDGLVKKTISISHNGISHHLISYYNVQDVKNDILMTPLQDPQLFALRPRPDFILNQNFRVAIDHEDNTYTLHVGEEWIQQAQDRFFRMRSASQEGMVAGWTGQRSLSVPQIRPHFYPQAPNQYPSVQQNGVPLCEATESNRDCCHPSAPPSELEDTLPTASSSPLRQTVPQIPDELPDLIHHRRNTIHTTDLSIQGAGFPELEQPDAYSGPNLGLFPASINTIYWPLATVAPTERDMMQGPYVNTISSKTTTGPVTPNESDWPSFGGQNSTIWPYLNMPSWNNNCAGSSPG